MLLAGGQLEVTVPAGLKIGDSFNYSISPGLVTRGKAKALLEKVRNSTPSESPYTNPGTMKL